jgi:hypothetical protein
MAEKENCNKSKTKNCNASTKPKLLHTTEKTFSKRYLQFFFQSVTIFVDPNLKEEKKRFRSFLKENLFLYPTLL